MSANSETTGRPTILVVDDSSTARSILQSVLEAERLNVVTASGAVDALARLEQCQPDIIITDSLMPGIDGFAFIAKLKAQPATRLIPVIMLTSTNPDDWDGRQTGPQPDVFVEKTADFEPLIVYIRSLLRRASSNP